MKVQGRTSSNSKKITGGKGNEETLRTIPDTRWTVPPQTVNGKAREGFFVHLPTDLGRELKKRKGDMDRPTKKTFPLGTHPK